ncbi:Os02g0590700, partial [Oryza sativa Japonica Group]
RISPNTVATAGAGAASDDPPSWDSSSKWLQCNGYYAPTSARVCRRDCFGFLFLTTAAAERKSLQQCSIVRRNVWFRIS